MTIMNIKNSYHIFAGLKGVRLVGLPVIIMLTIIYTLALLYIALIEIQWLGNTVPVEIKLGGYRDIPVNNYASIVSILFIIMYLHQLHFIRCFTESIFNNTTNQYLYMSSVNDLKFYMNYFFWRAVSLLKINVFYLVPLLLLYYLKEGVFVYTFITHLYILVGSSLFIAVVFDIFYYLTKGVRSGEFLTFILLLSISLLSFVLENAARELDYQQLIHLIHFIPDIISMPYQYVLKSLSAIYSQTKLFNPVLSLIVLFAANILLYRNLLVRLVNLKSV